MKNIQKSDSSTINPKGSYLNHHCPNMSQPFFMAEISTSARPRCEGFSKPCPPEDFQMAGGNAGGRGGNAMHFIMGIQFNYI